MENQEEQLNNQNYSEEEELINEDEDSKNNKSRVLLVIEAILFLLVVILAIIFFSSKGNLGFKIFQKSDDNGRVINNKLDSGDLVINNNITESQSNDSQSNDNQGNDNLIMDNQDVSTPKASNSEKVESIRLSLPVPDQSRVSTEDQIPEGAIKILGTEEGFLPAQFKVSAGEKITLALTVTIKYPFVLTFYDEAMPAISIGCGPYETRWVTFSVPNTPGEYAFRNDVFGKTGQTGLMIVE